MAGVDGKPGETAAVRIPPPPSTAQYWANRAVDQLHVMERPEGVTNEARDLCLEQARTFALVSIAHSLTKEASA